MFGAVVLPDHPKRLSPREQEVMRGRFLGMGYKQIASQLGIGEQTAKNYGKAAMQKLGVDSSLKAMHFLPYFAVPAASRSSRD